MMFVCMGISHFTNFCPGKCVLYSVHCTTTTTQQVYQQGKLAAGQSFKVGLGGPHESICSELCIFIFPTQSWAYKQSWKVTKTSKSKVKILHFVNTILTHQSLMLIVGFSWKSALLNNVGETLASISVFSQIIWKERRWKQKLLELDNGIISNTITVL